MSKTPLFRYVFSEEMKELLSKFAAEAATADRKTIKLTWECYVKQHKQSIEEEYQRFIVLGFQGSVEDVIAKLFFSMKYYHLKNIKNTEEEPEEDPPALAAPHRFDSVFLRKIEQHIQTYNNDVAHSPAESYQDFLQSIDDAATLDEAKLKKTYTNKYYLWRRRNHE